MNHSTTSGCSTSRSYLAVIIQADSQRKIYRGRLILVRQERVRVRFYNYIHFVYTETHEMQWPICNELQTNKKHITFTDSTFHS